MAPPKSIFACDPKFPEIITELSALGYASVIFDHPVLFFTLIGYSMKLISPTLKAASFVSPELSCALRRIL